MFYFIGDGPLGHYDKWLSLQPTVEGGFGWHQLR